jgi:predicted transcriptional regulator
VLSGALASAEYSIGEIACRAGLSRSTIRKYLRPDKVGEGTKLQVAHFNLLKLTASSVIFKTSQNNNAISML